MRRNLGLLAALVAVLVTAKCAHADDYGPAQQQTPPRHLTERGTSVIMGSFAFSNSGGEMYEDGGRLTQIAASFSMGHFFARDVAIGGKLGLTRTSRGDYSSSQVAIGPQVLLFIPRSTPPMQVSGMAYPYVGASATYVKLSSGGSYGSSSVSGYLFNIGVGVCIMVVEQAGFLVEGGYQWESYKSEGEKVKGNKFIIASGIAIFVR